MEIITSAGLSFDEPSIEIKSLQLASIIQSKSKTISALCCWSKEKIDYILCYEASNILNIPFIPLSSSIEFEYVEGYIKALPFSATVYKDNDLHSFNEEKTTNYCSLLSVSKLCFFTSGSTGEKKLIFLTEENITSAVVSIQERLNYIATDRIINFLPMSFDYGFYQYLLAKRSGATLCLIDEGLSLASVNKIDDFNATVLPLVPSMVSSFIALKGRRFIGDSINKITSTGEAISKGLIAQTTNIFKNAKFYIMYGLTECKRVSILLPRDTPDFEGSVGLPISCSVVTINNPNAEGIGDIIVTGDNVALGALIFDLDGEIHFRSFNGVLNTGDLGWIDSCGFLYVIGRSDSQIKILGQRTSLIEIENSTLSIKGVITCKASTDSIGCYLQCIVEENLTVKLIRHQLMKQLGAIASKISISIVKNIGISENYKARRPKKHDG